MLDDLIHYLTKEIVIGKKFAAYSLAQVSGDFQQTGIPLPGSFVEEFFLFLFRQALLGSTFLIVIPLIRIAPLGKTLFQGLFDCEEIIKYIVSEFVVKLRTDLFITGSKAQGLYSWNC